MSYGRNYTELASMETLLDGFAIKYTLENDHCGWSCFNDKWRRSEEGLVIGDNDRFDCNYYKIGDDVEVEEAQKEFEQDCFRFDTYLMRTISKGGIELHCECVISDSAIEYDDFNELLGYLVSDHGDNDLEQALLEAGTELGRIIVELKG